MAKSRKMDTTTKNVLELALTLKFLPIQFFTYTYINQNQFNTTETNISNIKLREKKKQFCTQGLCFRSRI